MIETLRKCCLNVMVSILYILRNFKTCKCPPAAVNFYDLQTSHVIISNLGTLTVALIKVRTNGKDHNKARIIFRLTVIFENAHHRNMSVAQSYQTQSDTRLNSYKQYTEEPHYLIFQKDWRKIKQFVAPQT